MPRRYRPREVIRVLDEMGWRATRQTGSHVIMTMGGRPGLVTVPQSRRELDRGTLGNILRQARMTRREFDQIAEEVL
jgi:predicted RNA binding protein YcfA (HicA-like mRNA interferase family)